MPFIDPGIDGHDIAPAARSDTPDRLRARIADLEKALEEAHADIERLKHNDLLTGLPNRACCLEELTARIEKAGPDDRFALIHLGIDTFSRINDVHGHEVADDLLVEVGWRLRSMIVSPHIDRAYRWGGDEFILFVDRYGRDLEDLCCELTDILSIPVTSGSVTLHPTVSAGVALFPEDGETADALTVDASIALFKARRQGRDGYHFFAPEMRREIQRSADIEHELRRALEEDELMLYFHPQISLRSGEVTGAECLVRWQHPERGLVSPTDFVDVAESSRLAPALGRYIFDHAFATARHWLDRGIGFGRIAINLSPRHMQIGALYDDFTWAMSKHDIEADLVTAEILESVFMEDHGGGCIELMKALHGLGVHVELDDFGTGFASLSHLTSLPIGGFKIDQGFTRTMLSEKMSAVVVEALMTMAQQIGFDVVVEGVETKEQLRHLMEFGYGSAQGYVVAEPLPFEQMTDWLTIRQHL